MLVTYVFWIPRYSTTAEATKPVLKHVSEANPSDYYVIIRHRD